MSDLKTGDLAIVKHRDTGEEELASYWDDSCEVLGILPADCPMNCCRAWRFVGTDAHARVDQVDFVKRVKVVDA